MDTIVATALVGTAQQQKADTSTGTPVDTLTEKLSIGEAERKLLLSAGAWAIYRQAGRVTEPLPTAPEPTPLESLTVCSPAITAMVESMLKGEHGELLPDVLARMQRASLRVPHEILPIVLNVQGNELRAAVFPVLGERGRWLSQFNAAWSWVANYLPGAEDTQLANAETIWQEGTLGQRTKILRLMRASDPAKARDWLTAVWKQEKAEARAELLSIFEVGLSADDEEFLENALDDRAASVRALVPPLLARIPTSAFVQRIEARADTMLTYAAKKLTVNLPDEIDKDWQRDGIIAKPPSGVGERTWWFSQVLSLISPLHWEERFRLSSDKLLAAAHANKEDKDMLLACFSKATLLHNSLDWMLAFWERWEKNQNATIDWEMRTTLLTRLPQQEAEQRVLNMLTNPKHPGRNDWEDLLAVLPSPWSKEFGDAYLSQLRNHVGTMNTKKNNYAYSDSWYQSLSIAARALPAECFARALEPWLLPEPENPNKPNWQVEYWRQELDKFTEALRIRQRLIKEIAL